MAQIRKTHCYLISVFFSLTFSSYAGTIHWIQQPKLSPDGKWVVFGYKGNIYKVASDGGPATALIVDSSYKCHPVWSHDGRTIAFASYQYGNADLFVVPAAGGNARRLTFESANDIPYDFSIDDQYVLFGSNRQELYSSIRFPAATFFMKVFEVPIQGGNSRMVSGAGMETGQYDPTGHKLIFEDRKNFEDSYRKHQMSSIARDVWIYDLLDKSYEKLTSFAGEDREPVWGENGYYYLSERSGTQNVFFATFEKRKKPRQLTFFNRHPVRNLSRAHDLLCFSYNGDVYTLTTGGRPRLIEINLDSDNQGEPESVVSPETNPISEMTVSKDGRQIAFVVQGDIFVCAAEGSPIRQLTQTPYQERSPDFSPDGRSLIYAVEHEKSWDIMRISCTDSASGNLYQPGLLRSDTVLGGTLDEFQGKYSPDGRKIAYLEERDVLKSYDLNTHTSHVLVPEGVNFSNHDGSQFFSWSPDSQHLLYESTEGGGGYENDIALLFDDGSLKRTNLTQSGFSDKLPKWTSDGAAMYWLNDSRGLRNFTSGSQQDVFMLFFDPGAWYDFHFHHRWPGDMTGNTMPGDTSSARYGPPGATKTSFHTERLTSSSDIILDDILSSDGKKLYVLEKAGDSAAIRVFYILSGEQKLLCHIAADQGKLFLNETQSNLLVFSGGAIQKIDLLTGQLSAVQPNFRTTLDAAAERCALFDHIYKVKKKRLLDPKMNQVDFDAYYQNYRKFLPYINNHFDFQILVNEFLGELNLSHNFLVFYPNVKEADRTAALGLVFDLTRRGDGLLVKKVLAGGPFDKPGTMMRPGMLVDSIDGVSVNGHVEWQHLMNHKAGKATAVSYHFETGSISYRDTIVAVSASEEVHELLFNAWEEKMEHLTDSLSGGRLGYAYLEQMDERNFRILYSAALGKNLGKAGLIVDTRFNRGGSLHDQLITFLTGKFYLTERRQGRITKGGESLVRWTKPSCVLMNEANYSDGFLFPYVYNQLHVGPLIGMPVAGTGTQVWYEEQVDDQFGLLIPQGGTYGIHDKTPTENRQLLPDVRVAASYESLLAGRDLQLEAAVKTLLKKCKTR